MNLFNDKKIKYNIKDNNDNKNNKRNKKWERFGLID